MRFVSLFSTLLAGLFAQGSTPTGSGLTANANPLVSSNFFVPKSADGVAPLTNAEKFKITARALVSPATVLRYAAQAGISQAEDHEAYYGLGSAGYGRRVVLRFADGTVEGFFTHAVFPSLRHEDPRYFQAGEGSFLHRAGYAFSRIFVTRTDAGDTQVNVSELAGSATAAGISTFAYHPRGERTLGNALNVWGDHVAFDALWNGMIEFWPDIWRKIRPDKK